MNHNRFLPYQVGNAVMILAAGIVGYVIAVSVQSGNQIIVGVRYDSPTGGSTTGWFSVQDVRMAAAVPAAAGPPPVPQAPPAPNPAQPGQYPAPNYPGPDQNVNATAGPVLPYTPTQPPPAQYGQPPYYQPHPGQPQRTAPYGYYAQQGFYPPGYSGPNSGGNMGGRN